MMVSQLEILTHMSVAHVLRPNEFVPSGMDILEN
jgi:hypothetical protein